MVKITRIFLYITFSSLAIIGCKNFENNQKTVNDETKTGKKALQIAAKPVTASFQIEGMTCAMGCAKTIEKKLAKMDGVQKVKVDFDKKEANVNFDAAVLTSDKLAIAIESTGDGNTYKVSNSKSKN